MIIVWIKLSATGSISKDEAKPSSAQMHKRQMVGESADENNLIHKEHPFSNRGQSTQPGMDSAEVCVISPRLDWCLGWELGS